MVGHGLVRGVRMFSVHYSGLDIGSRPVSGTHRMDTIEYRSPRDDLSALAC